LAVAEYIKQVLVDNELVQGVKLDPALAKRGETLFGEKLCDNCHRIGERPGGIGPDLTDAAVRLRPEWTVNFIQKPSHYLDTRMPNLQVSAEEAKALATYILGVKR
jgi:mono/diheme cytochrome c family protein